ncbi:MAG: hypothetical protein LBO69_07430 [Ignavibacteria bacterium]|jgi:hypothetical protein|nr:hypothetical protein [Ignavibacteria bacterium]
MKELLISNLPDKLKCGREIYKSRSNYEQVLCDELGWKCEKNTYWDADYKGVKIEIKKGNTWLNVRRYAQLVINDIDCSNDITAIFTKDDKDKTIRAVYFVKTSVIIEIALKMDKEIAKKIIELDKHWKEICKEYLGNDTDSQVNFKVSAYKSLSFCHKIFE